MDEITVNFKNRSNLLTCVPLNGDYTEMVKQIELKYPGFKVVEQEFNPGRVRWVNEKDHYEFYLEREQ
jgi:hypothetical protein